MSNAPKESIMESAERRAEAIDHGNSFPREQWADASAMLARLLGSGDLMDSAEATSASEILSQLRGELTAGSLDDPEALREAWNGHRHQVLGSPSELPLEESVYKPWTSDPSHPLAGSTGLTGGDSASHMADMLQRFELIPESGLPHSPDHLAVLLEFLAFLLEERPMDDVVAFCEDHLDWLGDLHREALQRDIHPLFRDLISAAQSLVSRITCT